MNKSKPSLLKFQTKISAVKTRTDANHNKGVILPL